MTDPTTERYRTLLADLRAAVAERVRAEERLLAPQDDELGPASDDTDDSVAALARESEDAIAAADARLAATRQEVEDRYRVETANAEADHRRAVAAVEERHAAEVAAAEAKYEENAWMLSSVLDDESEESPKRQYESLKDQLQQSREQFAARWEDLKSQYDQAVSLLETRRQRVGPPPAPPAAPRTRKEAAERFDDAAEVARTRFDRLKRQTVPRLFAGMTFVPIALAIWGGVFAAIYLLVDPAAVGMRPVKPVEQVLIAAGIGLAACVVALLTVWGIAVRQTSQVFDPLQSAVVGAQTQHQAWLKFAKEELQRRDKDYRDRYAAIVEHRERSSRKFVAERDRRLAELRAERETGLREPAERRQAVLRESSERRGRELAAAQANHAEETAAPRARFEQERNRLLHERNRRAVEREAAARRAWDTLVGGWTDAIRNAREATEVATADAEELDSTWASFAAGERSMPETIPAGVRIGEYEIDLNRLPDGVPADRRLAPEATTFRLPAVLPFPDSPSLVLNATGPGRAAAVSVLQVAMLRLLTSLPAGKVRFTILDPVGLGENFAAFMHLADYDDLLISNRIWTEPGHIEEQLGKLTEHMENVFQKYLRNEFESIEEYNVRAGEVAEPYRVLVAANFPAGFTERAASRLASIAASGPRCGVYTLVGVDTQQPVPRGFDRPSLEADATVLNWTAGEFLNPAFGPDPVPLRPDAPPAPAEFAAVVRRAGELSKDIRRVEVPFKRIAPAEDAWWTGDSRKSIDCPLGRSGATKLQHLRLGIGTSQHALLAGKTGSGKSTLLHVLVTNLALRYGPDEIEFFLIDFKKGVEFKTYATHELPHARVVAIESDREFGVSALERLDAILKERGDLFREAGVQDVASYRNANPDARLPRILLVVDEFQEFFTEDDRYSQTAGLLLDRLVRQGRAFGIHVLLGSQTLGGTYSLARTTIGQMAVRVALQCSEADAHLILSEDNTAARLLTRPGEAIYNDANGLIEGNSPFQISWLGDAERDELLDRLRSLSDRQGRRPTSAIVFEGNVPADPSRNPALADLLDGVARPETAVPTAWLGEAVAITGPTPVRFRRQSGANLLVVGQEPAAALGLLSTCFVALAAGTEDRPSPGWLGQNAPEGGHDLAARSGAFCPRHPDSIPSFVLLTSDASEPGRIERWRGVIDATGRDVRLLTPADGGTVIAEIADEVARRRDAGGADAPPVFLLIDDLSRFRDLRKSDDDFGFSGFGGEKPAVSPGKRFAEILREGPAVGVHVLAWCDSYNNVDRWLGRSLVKEFEMRVAFQMSGSDSSNLIDSPAAGRLGTNRALLHLDERGTTEKFRPYGPPADAWLNGVRDRLRPAAEPSEPLDIDEWIVT